MDSIYYIYVFCGCRRHGFGSVESGTSSQVNTEGKSPLVLDETEDMEEQPLVRHCSRQISPVIAEPTDTGQPSYSASDPPWLDIDRNPQLNGHTFERDQWGGISSQEHDEAVMLEAAMFGGIPDERGFQFEYPTRQIPHPPSPTLMAQRLLREQQDDEYLASLQADREKELKAQRDAELCSLEEANAREAALQKKRHEEAETYRKHLEEEVEFAIPPTDWHWYWHCEAITRWQPRKIVEVPTIPWQSP